MCEDVLEADEGPCERVEFVHGGVDAVETRTAAQNLLTVGDGQKEPAVDLKRLPVCRSHRLQREQQTQRTQTQKGNFLKTLMKYLNNCCSDVH